MHCNKKLVCISFYKNSVCIKLVSLALLLGNFVRVFYGDFVTFSIGFDSKLLRSSGFCPLFGGTRHFECPVLEGFNLIANNEWK